MAYSIYYISADKIHKTQGGFSTLQQLRKEDHVVIEVKKDGKSVLGVVGGMLDDVAELVQKGLHDPEESSEGPT